jgi:hypothetical protein
MVEMCDMSSREKTSGFMTNAGEVNDIRFNGKHLQMATTGATGGLKLWDTGDLTALPVSLNDNGRFVIAFEFSPDGEVILQETSRMAQAWSGFHLCRYLGGRL